MTNTTGGVRAALNQLTRPPQTFPDCREQDPYDRIEEALFALRGLSDLIAGKKASEYGVPCHSGDLSYLLDLVGREIETANQQYFEQRQATEKGALK